MNERSEIPPPLDALEPLDAPGPAEPLDRARADRMIESVLDRWEAERVGEPAAARAPRPRARWPWLALAAAVVVAGAAAAWWRAQPADAPAPTAPAPSPRAAPSLPDPAEEPEERTPAETAENTEASEARDERPARSARRPRPAPAESPDDLLQLANAHRREGRWREAERTYARVLREHPGTLGAYVARAGAASIRLEHLGDARGARRLYEQALRERPGGPLDAEVRAGLARAARRTGDRAAEIAALRGLVAAHPGTTAADRARARLEELGEE